MPVYEYTGLTAAGKQVKGIRNADSPRGLRTALKRDGVFVTSYQQEKDKGGGGAKEALSKEVRLGRSRQTAGTQDIAIMTRQLATLVGAGVPLIEALTALQDQVDHPALERVVGLVKQRVNEGATMADALADHPRIFSKIYVNMVAAGESSGALDVVLVRLADFTEGQARLRQKIVSALTYPLVMIIIGLIILAILMAVVVPKVTRMFEDIGATLPFTTRALIWTADLTREWWWLIGILGVLFVVLFRAWTRTESGTRAWAGWKLAAPLFGDLNRMVAMARFSRTLSTLLSSGVPILSALQIVRNVVNNQVLAEVIDEAREAIQEGDAIASPLKRSGQFPPLVYHMVSIGEKSGQLEEMLLNVAAAYESQVESRITGLTSLLEPLMIVAMGVVVAFIVFSILMPILQLNTMIQG
ncbi:MAG: type II secretion system inner membrane protein GspF [Deltaproteobacteria bacterium]|nr:type II secretion system inner membrane protein GspF [Deltaproteobacteria bacterium]